MLIITTSPSTSAVSTEGLREMTVASAMAARWVADCALLSAGIGFSPSDHRDRSLFPRAWQVETKPNSGAQGSRIAAFDPAHKAADVDSAGEREAVVGLFPLRRVLVFGPVRHETLQARHIQEPARQRGGLEM